MTTFFHLQDYTKGNSTRLMMVILGTLRYLIGVAMVTSNTIGLEDEKYHKILVPATVAVS